MNYILDFGGVLYKIDPNRTINAFLSYSETPEKIKQMNKKEFYENRIFRDYEMGTLSSSKFRDLIRTKYEIKASDSEFDEAWNATLVGLRPQAFKSVKKLGRVGRVTLLSNTNEIHYNHFEPECRDLFSLFERTFFSFKINKRKPEREIYDFVLKSLGFKDEETYFLDDSLANVETARSIGLKARLIKENQLETFAEEQLK